MTGRRKPRGSYSKDTVTRLFYSQSFPPFPRTFPKHDPDVSTPSRWFLMPAAEAVRLEGDAAKGTVTPLFKIPKISQISRRHCAGVPGRRVPKVQYRGLFKAPQIPHILAPSRAGCTGCRGDAPQSYSNQSYSNTRRPRGPQTAAERHSQKEECPPGAASGHGSGPFRTPGSRVTAAEDTE